ncbi:MAG: hypothetical protein IKK83_03800 [Clostridia bacterium]|nr:hypothetical protein [Clostridia bacterium]
MKILRIIFCILSVILVAAMVVACVAIAKDGDSSTEDSSSFPTESSAYSEEAASSEEESSQIYSSESAESTESSEESVESSESSESSEESVESVDSSEEALESIPDSSAPESSAPTGNTDPITTAPSGVSASEGDVFFNDSVFVGHSVMVHFSNRVNGWRTSVAPDFLGNALFCCSSSFSFYNNENQTPDESDNVLPKYRGQPYNIEDLPSATGAKRIFLGLMGLNDLAMVGTADTCGRVVADEAIRCIEKVKEKNPDVEIVVLASTYLTRDVSYKRLNNRNMSLLNSYVLDYCNLNGIDFIDVATPLCDGDGYLASVYSSDNYCHLVKQAYYIWIDELREYAAAKQAGTWENPKAIPLFNK